MNSHGHYDGYRELKSYVLSVKSPSFESFVAANRKEIATWSLTLKASSSEELFLVWTRRFIQLIRVERPLLKIRTCKKDTDLWNMIAQNKNEREKASAKYLTNSIRTLNAFAEEGSDALIADLHRSKRKCFNGDIERASSSSSKDTTSVSSKDITSSSSNDIDSYEEKLVTTPDDTNIDSHDKSSLMEKLFGMGLKKLSLIAWDEEEIRLLNELDAPLIDIDATLCNVVKSILIKNGCDMDSSDLVTLKLCLSRIINLMNPKQVERVIQYLQIGDQKKQVQDSVKHILKHGLDKESHKAYDKILDVFETGGCLEDALLVTDALKRPLLERRERSTDLYRMLKITEHVLGYLHSCKDDDSEATVYRRIAMILDELFCDTDVILCDGETCSECTKNTRVYNDIMFGSTSESSFGRKIDLLIKYGENQQVEISSNEFKKNGVTPAMATMQQCKNLRVNGTILDSLQRLNPSNPVKQVVAMDWLGYVGYMFALLDVDGVYYAEKIGVLLLPKSTMELHSFINTLDILFSYKRFIISLGQRTVAAYNKRQTVDILREVIDVADSSPLTQDHHDIFFTPTTHRKRKIKYSVH